jgi:Arc/MetJ family transcription regulator
MADAAPQYLAFQGLWHKYGSADMGARMKTTIEISEALLVAAKRTAIERNTTLRTIVEAALRRYLETSGGGADAGPRLRRCTFRGRGLQAGIGEGDWSTIRARAYEDRGG